MIQHARIRWWVAGVLVLCVAPFAAADLSDPGVTITASNASGTATPLTIPLSQFYYDPGFSEWSYFQMTPTYLMSGSTYIATVEKLYAFIVDDPMLGPSIALQYDVVGGTSQTNFTISSGFDTFAPISASLAAASMDDTFTITDLNLNSQVRLAALNNYAFKTYYGEAGSGNEYFFHGSTSVGSFQSTQEGGIATAFDNYPTIPGVYESLPVAVDRIRTETAFSLTAEDRAQVIHALRLNAIPEPATVGLVILGGFLIRRRR